MKEGIQSNIAQVNKYLERLMKFDKAFRLPMRN